MSAQARHILVTGSNGFIGRHLVSALLQAPDFHDCRFTFLDFTSDGTVSDPRGRVIAGDFGDRDMISDAIDGRADVVLHLAGILGGAAEANYALSRKVNIEGTLNLFEALRDADNSPRVVFASSIAVFGTDIPPAIDDDTIPQPSMIYGAQKRMMEVAVEHFSARGWIDGFAIRLPGIVARRDADARIKSAFLNQLFSLSKQGATSNCLYLRTARPS